MATHLLQPDAAVLDHTVAMRPVLEIVDGRIVNTFASADALPGGSPPIQRVDGTLLPGFVDLQVNGAGGRAVDETSAEALDHIAATVAEHGAAAFLPTLITAPIPLLLRQIAAVADWVEVRTACDSSSTASAFPLGIHVEGPFLSNAGAHDPDALVDPSPASIERLIDAGRGKIRLVTLSPSRVGAAAAVAQFREAGITVALGHGRGQDGIAECVAAGATMATHLFNAMGDSDHREPGMAGRIMDDDALSCSLIVDGVHVHEMRVRHAVRTIGVQRAILITDSVSAMGMPDGEYTLGGFSVTLDQGAVRLADGTLAGSALTMFEAATRFAAAVPTAGPWTIAQVAARNPAAVIDCDGFGRIATGYRSEFARLSADGAFETLRID